MQKAFGHITAARGFRAAGICCGIKAGVRDLALLVSEARAAAAGTFTTNSFCAAPVILSRERLRSGRARAIVVNSGCANAATGRAGMRDAEVVTRDAARLLSIDRADVLAASTGRIGRRLPVDKIRSGLNTLVGRLSVEGGRDAARAILTTDTCSKEALARRVIGRREITVGGMAKGAGMIHPRMATMLAFITTDAAVTPRCLKELLRKSVEKSFNRISVDGDLSTNDSVFILASGLAGNPVIERKDSNAGRLFSSALDEITAALAEKIVRDGEGASKFIEIMVRGARDRGEAKRLGFAIANSPLFKTAMYGEEPNWGRILSALGGADVALSPERVSVVLQGECVFRRGAPAGADEVALRTRMRMERISVEIILDRGRAEERILTCDLTPGYVELNKT
jgi:glutamate N-acetyltransferase / amino-acid N-acetyltransferase